MNEQSEKTGQLNIYQRINEVRKKIEYVRKDKEVKTKQGGYKVVTHDAVTGLIREHLIEQGVVIVPNQRSSEITQFGQAVVYAAWYEAAFVNIDNPDDRIVITLETHGSDYGDKAPGKSLSLFVKNAILKLFSLETGEDEESRVEIERKASPIGPEQAEEIRELLRQYGKTEDEFLEKVVNRMPMVNVAMIEDMTSGVAAKAKQYLENRIKDAEKRKGNGSEE